MTPRKTCRRCAYKCRIVYCSNSPDYAERYLNILSEGVDSCVSIASICVYTCSSGVRLCYNWVSTCSKTVWKMIGRQVIGTHPICTINRCTFIFCTVLTKRFANFCMCGVEWTSASCSERLYCTLEG
jgi:hypothetical protein